MSCRRTSVTVLDQDIGDTSVGLGGDTSAARLGRCQPMNPSIPPPPCDLAVARRCSARRGLDLLRRARHLAQVPLRRCAVPIGAVARSLPKADVGCWCNAPSGRAPPSKKGLTVCAIASVPRAWCNPAQSSMVGGEGGAQVVDAPVHLRSTGPPRGSRSKFRVPASVRQRFQRRRLTHRRDTRSGGHAAPR